LHKLFRVWLGSCCESSMQIQKTTHIAIIGGGIGGVALAVACLPRNFYDMSEIAAWGWSQGYGLTLQQASKAIEDWVFSLEEGSDFHQTFTYYRWKSDRNGEWESGCNRG
jgi:glycine/D-amino acid oxidase-like deaminating enzyme